jgi:hypothetical protein
MFGYILVNKKELSAEDQRTYKTYYCGVCQALKERAGRKGQMLLQYDMTFLSLLLSGLYEPKESEKEFKCKVHPLGTKNAVVSDLSQYAADMNILLGYYNLLDDYLDDKSINARKMAESLKATVEELIHLYPRQAKAIKESVQKTAEAESCRETNLSLISGFSGKMVGEVFAWKDDMWSDELRNIGFYLGKFIYLMDAYEDMDKDEKNHSFNPLLIARDKEEGYFETHIRQLLTTQVAECASRFEKLPVIKNLEIIRNILYSGVWMKYDLISKKHRHDMVRR